jgi:hypothetical protein
MERNIPFCAGNVIHGQRPCARAHTHTSISVVFQQGIRFDKLNQLIGKDTVISTFRVVDTLLFCRALHRWPPRTSIRSCFSKGLDASRQSFHKCNSHIKESKYPAHKHCPDTCDIKYECAQTKYIYISTSIAAKLNATVIHT